MQFPEFVEKYSENAMNEIDFQKFFDVKSRFLSSKFYHQEVEKLCIYTIIFFRNF